MEILGCASSKHQKLLYGGTAANRVRFLTAVTEEVLEVRDEKRIGVRLSPTGTFNDMRDENLSETFSAAVERLDNYRIGYLHVVESTQDGRQNSERDWALLRRLRELWTGFYIVNGGYDAARAKEAVLTGYADTVAYGRAFLANPDLPRRLQLGAALNKPDQQTFYGGDARGYTDYASLSQDSPLAFRRACSRNPLWKADKPGAGVNAPETMFPYSDPVNIGFLEACFRQARLSVLQSQFCRSSVAMPVSRRFGPIGRAATSSIQ